MSNMYKFPLKMHVGAPCEAIVKIDEEVKRGQLIAIPTGLGANIHSSVNGVIKNIDDTTIYIEASIEQNEDFVKISDNLSILESIKEAGIVGAGGAGFPTSVKLGKEMPGGSIIANCVECEPILSHNIAIIEENPDMVLRGVKYAMECVKAEHGYIAIKDIHKKAIKALESKLANYPSIKIHEMPNLYPMGEERAIIHEIFDMWLEPTQLPLEANCAICNCETLCNIVRAVEDRKPVIDKDITVGGKLGNHKNENVFFQVPIGTSIKTMIEKCGGIDGEYGEIIVGGPYTGKAGNIDEDSMTKMSGGIIVTIPFPTYEGKVGLLVCACGANEERLRDLASKMGSDVVDVQKCKNVVDIRGNSKCKEPGT